MSAGCVKWAVPAGQDQNGSHVKPRDPADIAWGITGALQDAEQSKRLGQNGRTRVLQEFSWDVIAQKTVQVYNELLESKKT